MYHHACVQHHSTEQNCKIISEEQGLKDVNEAMLTHSENAVVIEAACSAIWSLSMEGKFLRMHQEYVLCPIYHNQDCHFSQSTAVNRGG